MVAPGAFSHLIRDNKLIQSSLLLLSLAIFAPHFVELACPGTQQFQCTSGKCIPSAVRCNGQCDCEDQSDETNCPSCNSNRTFWCNNRRCISLEYVCDGTDDCGDGSDEAPNRNCPRCNGFLCTRTKRCLTNVTADRCDGYDDCGDLSDEEGCSSCSRQSFLCQSSRRCIPASARCNGKYDCRGNDRSDEFNCPIVTCAASYQFRCANNRQCIFLADRCNSRKDCLDGSDEVNCTCPLPSQQFQCRNNICIWSSRRCDGHQDCSNGEDETGCTNLGNTCSILNATTLALFRCSNGRCIEARRRCNSFRDCEDGSDERNCQVCNPLRQFTCRTGGCINSRFRCDGEVDCYDGSDEEGCSSLSCKNGAFLCANKRCITLSKLCDNVNDCGDRSDELPANCSCRSDEFACQTFPKQCIPITRRCDGIADCQDPYGSDERNCTVCKGNNAYLCADSSACISSCLLCDGVPQCADGSDEQNCKDCAFRCQSGNLTICLKRYEVCDGFHDCNSGEDEQGCSTCRSNGHLCPNSTVCIRGTDICDKKIDCPLYAPTDEMYCDCARGSKFKCGNGTCIWHNFVCDGVVDCLPYGEDEANCQRFNNLWQGSSTYTCANGQKVITNGNNNNVKCDGVKNCRDGSDESGCGETCSNGRYLCPKNGKCLAVYKDCLDVDACAARCESTKEQCSPCRPVVSVLNGTQYYQIPTQHCNNCQCVPM